MKFQKRAFSLIEVSVVLVIVGIFVAGIFASNAFITKARLAAAQSLLKSSPIRDIKDNALWLETSAFDSFAGSEASDGTPLTTWYEQRSATSKVTLTAVDGGPTYSNTINRIHAVKFAGAGYFTFDGSFLNNTDYTITILEKREVAGGNNYFLGDSAATTTNQSLLLGYSADGQIIHSQGASSSYSALVSGYSKSSDSPRLLTFTHSSTAGKKLYINGVLAAKDETNLAPLTGIGTLSFGKGYTGQIGELAIFTRALKDDEIKSVEGYVAQKFSSKLVGNASTDCLGKVVTTSGCEVSSSGGGGSTCPVSVVGVTSTTPVAEGSGSLTCNATGYAGTSAYTCTSGTLSAAACGCDTANGYSLSGGVCVLSPLFCTGTVAADTSIVSGYAIHKFTSSGTITCSTTRTVEVLVVGGGGGGGWRGAGGGAGGYVYNSALSLASGTYSINVGAGGAGGIGVTNQPTAKGSNGQESSIKLGATSIITAVGGGGGGAGSAGTTALAAGNNGGSGGGGSYWSDGSRGSGTSGQGYAGGGGNSGSVTSGGGGGAGGVGDSGGSNGGKGGNGISNSITGTALFYAAGGGGGAHNSLGGAGGSGIGGNGSSKSPESAPTAGALNTGSGGGGGNNANYQSGAAGSAGVVILRYSI